MDDELDKFLYDKLNSEKKLPEQTSNEFKKIAYNTIYGDSKKIKIRHYPVTKVGMVDVYKRQAYLSKGNCYIINNNWNCGSCICC